MVSSVGTKREGDETARGRNGKGTKRQGDETTGDETARGRNDLGRNGKGTKRPVTGQTRMKVDESWQARFCMRVFSALVHALVK